METFEPEMKSSIRGFNVLTVNGVSGVYPTRGTPGSAGYDLYLPETVYLYPGDIRVVFIHVSAYMQFNEFFDIRVRSSIGKRGIMLLNGSAIIDADYNKDIGLILKNVTDSPVYLYEGERVCQGIFNRYYLADYDHVLSSSRQGGFGSTNSKSEGDF